jgi:hypothetical protein
MEVELMGADQGENTYGEYKWRVGLIRSYARLIAYRFYEQLGPPLRLYKPYEGKLSNEQIQEKAKASLATSGVFFAFSVAILAALITVKEFRDSLTNVWGGLRSWQGFLGFSLNIIFPYWLIWQERFISAVSSLENLRGKTRSQIRSRRYRYLWPALFFSLLIPAAFPLIFRPSRGDVFVLSGFSLIILSAFFLLLSLEFYDYAAGWRQGEEFRFHLASMASHSMSFGVSLAMVGVSLLICLLNFSMGRIVTCTSLIVVFAMPEIERQLGAWRNPSGRTSIQSAPVDIPLKQRKAL